MDTSINTQYQTLARRVKRFFYLRSMGSIFDLSGLSWFEFFPHPTEEPETIEMEDNMLHTIHKIPIENPKSSSTLWPDASTLAEYEKLSPGIAKEILETLLDSLSKESELRRENEQKFVQALTAAVSRGQYYALFSVLITAGLGGYLAWLKYPWASAIVVGMNVALLVASFVRSSVRSLPKVSNQLLAKKEEDVPEKGD